MSLYQKLKLLVRATAEDPARKLVEMNDIKIFEQEMADVERALKAAKLYLAHVKAESKSLVHSIDELSEKTKLREQQALQALEKDETLAQELAALIAEDELLIQDQQKQLARLNKQEIKLSHDLKNAALSIQSHQRQVQILKVSQYGLKGGQYVSHNTQSLNGALRDLNDSLDSIKNRQRKASYLEEAEGEVLANLSGENLDKRLASSGIPTGKHDANVVLERLKQMNSATSSRA